MNQNRNAPDMVRKIDTELMDDIMKTLSDGGEKTGYEVYKSLKKSGRRVSSRLVYHYLHLALKDNKLDMESKNETGKFSWGTTARKNYYRIK